MMSHALHSNNGVVVKRLLLRGVIPDDLLRNYNISMMISEAKRQAATFYAYEYFYKSEVYSILYEDIHDVSVEVFVNAAAMQYEFIITGYVPDDQYARYLFTKGN